MNKTQIVQKVYLILFFALYVAALCVASRFLLTGLGSHPHKSAVVALTIAFIFLCSSKTTFILSLIISSLLSLYVPVGLEYGSPNFQAVASLFATDFGESLEFLGQMPFKSYCKAIAIPLLISLGYFIAKKNEIKPWKNKTLVIISVIALVFLVHPTNFLSKLNSSLTQVRNEKQKLQSLVTRSDWGNSVYQGVPKDYVLVIGESVRKDYMHLYGYPVENTPFLDSVPAIVVNGLTAGDTYTIGSLRLMLTKPDKKLWQPNYSLNIIDLANSAGFKTIWLSNQGYIGRYDTPITAIANRADEKIFSVKGSYDYSKQSDMILLNKLKTKLETNAGNQPRLFVLHILGSHPNACERIKEMQDPYKVKNKKFSYVACYISSIKYTDQLLENLYLLMQKNSKNSHRPFSILYFADHGLTHRTVDNVIKINNNLKGKRHYNIPLVLIESNSKTRNEYTSQKSGLNFTEGLGTWLNISNHQAMYYNLFDGKNDETDYGLKEKLWNIKSKDDPAIDLTKYLIIN